MWTDKYEPKTLEEFVGNTSAVSEIQNWLKNWKNETAILIYGQQGTGKTILLHILAKELDYTLFETDASDVRSAKNLKEEIGTSLQQQTLFFKSKLVVFDEIDGLSRADRGAVKEFIRIIKDSKYPVVLIANDAYHPKLRELRNYCKLIKFNKVHANSIVKILDKIAKNEGIKCDEKVLKSIAFSVDGDLKAAIHDLELISMGKSTLTLGDVSVIGGRDLERSVFESLKVIFKTENAQNAAEVMYDIEKSPDETIQWIRENLPLEYTDQEDLSKAYNYLSRADVFKGRISRKQYWRYLVYVNLLMSVGVALAKKEKYQKFVKYNYPSKIKQMGRTKIMRAQENELAGNLGRYLHCSRKIAKQYIPLLNLIEKKQPKLWEELSTIIS